MSLVEALNFRVANLESTNSELYERVLQLSSYELEYKRSTAGLLAENTALSRRVSVLEAGLLRLETAGSNNREDSVRRIETLIDRHSISKISGEVSFRDALQISGNGGDISPIQKLPPTSHNESPNCGEDFRDRPGPSRRNRPELLDNDPNPVPPAPGPPDVNTGNCRSRKVKRQKRKKRELIEGSAAGMDEFRAAPVPGDRPPSGLGWVYVTRVHLDVTEEILRRHVSNLGIDSSTVVRVILPSNRTGVANYSAFRVGVRRDCVQSLLRKEAWPSGVHVGRWFFRGRQRPAP